MSIRSWIEGAGIICNLIALIPRVFNLCIIYRNDDNTEIIKTPVVFRTNCDSHSATCPPGQNRTGPGYQYNNEERNETKLKSR